MKKIVINALTYKQNSSGIGVMIRELFGEFAKVVETPCQIILSKDSPDIQCDDSVTCVRAPWYYRQGIRRIFYQTAILGWKYCKNSFLLTIDSKVPLILPRNCEIIPIITDLAVFRMSEVYQKSRVLLWKLQYQFIRRRTTHYFTISEFSKQEMIDILQIPSEQIRILPCACAENYQRVEDVAQLTAFRTKYQLSEHYILFVGNQNPRKNLECVIRAFDRVKMKNDICHQLVIIGEMGWKFNVSKVLAGINFTKDIRFVGFVPDAEMPMAYSAADLFVFPTLYEGFGVPVLEAQKCGTAVLTSKCSALPEVGGDGAWYVDPHCEEQIADGIEQLLRNEKIREDLIQKGYQNVKRFSWKNSAEILRQELEKIGEL